MSLKEIAKKIYKNRPKLASLKVPSTKKSKMSYKSGNPLKKLLSHNRATIKVGGY